MSRSPARLAILLLAAAAGAAPSYASSPDAWDEFRQEVQQKCAALAEGRIEQPRIVVDPFGTESYGVAILTGKAVGSETVVSSICVFDKKSQTAEISGELPADQVTITVP
jgi:hypothetical protein